MNWARYKNVGYTGIKNHNSNFENYFFLSIASHVYNSKVVFGTVWISGWVCIGLNMRLSLTKALRKWSVPEAIWLAGEDGGAEQIEASLAVIHHGVSVVEALGVALLRVTNGVLHKAWIRAVYHCKIKTARCLMSDRVRKDRRNQWRRLNSRITGAASEAISIKP